MPCPDPLLVHAYWDGELDAAAALEIERHLASCRACSALGEDIATVRRALRGGASYHRLEPARRSVLLRGLPPEGGAGRGSGRRPFWAGAATGLAAALAAFAVVSVLQRGPSTALENDLLSAHLRALESDHLIDVTSSDRHTVKPWFAGRVDVSPVVADFASAGYPLVGGRVDYVAGRRVAVTVYRHGAHVIDVFAWPASDAAPWTGVTARNGYQFACWSAASIGYCAVSDTAARELGPLQRLLEDAGSQRD